MKAIYIDTETGGLDPRVHALTHVAAIAFEIDAQGAWVLDEVSLPIWLSPDANVCRRALELQGATLEMLSDSASRLSEWDAITRFADWLEGHEKPFNLFAHNAPFDAGFVNAWLDRSPKHTRAGEMFEIKGRHARWICTMQIAKQLAIAGRIASEGFSLDSLAAHLGVQGRSGTAHNALEDCQVGVRVTGALWRRAGWA